MVSLPAGPSRAHFKSMSRYSPFYAAMFQQNDPSQRISDGSWVPRILQEMLGKHREPVAEVREQPLRQALCLEHVNFHPFFLE